MISVFSLLLAFGPSLTFASPVAHPSWVCTADGYSAGQGPQSPGGRQSISGPAETNEMLARVSAMRACQSIGLAMCSTRSCVQLP